MEKVAVKYIGHRETYMDGVYGSRITFVKGQSVLVPADLAAKLLRHSDVYVPGNEKKAEVVEVAQEQPVDETQSVRDNINNMDKNALATFAKTTYRIDLDKRLSINALREQVVGLVDQYGAA